MQRSVLILTNFGEKPVIIQHGGFLADSGGAVAYHWEEGKLRASLPLFASDTQTQHEEMTAICAPLTPREHSDIAVKMRLNSEPFPLRGSYD